MEAHDLYRTARQQLVDLCRGLRDDEASRPVPACPGWAVKDVAAHVTGIAVDVLGGNLEGLGTDAWTARQVDSRRGRSLSEVLDEYVALGGALDELAATNPASALRMGRDVTVHEQDIRAALACPGNRSTDSIFAVCKSYAAGFVERVEAAALPAVAVEVDGSTVGSSGATVVVSGNSFELLHTLTGRRSRRQAEALEWNGNHPAHVALMPTYGDFQILDVAE